MRKIFSILLCVHALCLASAPNLGTIPCEPLPAILAERSHELQPEISSALCLQFSHTQAETMWRIVWQGSDTNYVGKFHPWKGEIGNVIAQDLEQMQTNMVAHNPLWKKAWIQTIAISFLLTLQGVVFATSGFSHAHWNKEITP